MRFQDRCYRAHDPKWSFTPISGAGAANTGGRFNLKSSPTLYLSLKLETAVLEVMQGLANRLPPVVVCEYDVDILDVVDLRTAATQKALGVSFSDLSCPWLKFQAAGKIAPSQQIALDLAKDGANGMLVPSFVPGAPANSDNLILWNWGPKVPNSIVVYDPDNRLPKDQKSWT